MAGYIEGMDRQQATLFPERLDELVAGDALVRVLDGFVAQLDVGAAGFIRAKPAGIGRPGYRPGDLLRLFLYGYLNGVRLSRGLERACWMNLELAWLLQRLQPDFKTIADFRKDNGAAITWTCQAFVRFALSHGLIKGRQVATDGSRFAAASSRRRRQPREDVEAEIAAHDVAIAGYLTDLEAADALVDPAEQLAERKRVKKALAELEAKAKAKREALATTTTKKLVVAEPESVIFGQSDGRQPSYNVQLTVHLETQVIIDAEPIGNSSANDAVTCEQIGFIPVFPVMRTVNPHGQFFNRTDFKLEAERDLMVCPAGNELKPRPKPQDGAIAYTAKKADCGACALKPQCTKARQRTVLRLINEPALERVAQRLKAEPTLMNKRAQSVEPAFGTLKRWLHGGRFHLRGRLKAKTELGLVTLAFNLKRLSNLHGTARLRQALT